MMVKALRWIMAKDSVDKSKVLTELCLRNGVGVGLYHTLHLRRPGCLAFRSALVGVLLERVD